MLTEKRDKDEYLDASRVGVGVIAERDDREHEMTVEQVAIPLSLLPRQTITL